jgi:hypothetical protein
VWKQLFFAFFVSVAFLKGVEEQRSSHIRMCVCVRVCATLGSSFRRIKALSELAPFPLFKDDKKTSSNEEQEKTNDNKKKKRESRRCSSERNKREQENVVSGEAKK